MKALKISLSHGRIWVAETSDGKRAQGASLQGVIDQLLPARNSDMQPWNVNALEGIFLGIHDSGSDGQIAQGRASA